ncbi:hypothetical protein LCGC14_0869950 [marine sediment metagenome]|uniref:Uncharacterized protein n=1 Tax=marine sediment metagenome TaxID=412755 RepID=A0A0F9SC10_9ZZZZ
MKDLTVSIEKIVKYDENDLASIECPVCDHRDFTVIFGKDNRVTLFCREDDFSLTRMSDLSFQATYTVYENLGDEYKKTQRKNLESLYKKDFVTYTDFITVAKFGLGKNV